MPVTRRGAGTKAEAASGNVTPALPAGVVADDILIVSVVQADNVVATVTGYTEFQAVNRGTPIRAALFWKRAAGGESAPTVTHAAGNSIIAKVTAYAGCVSSGSPINASANDTTGQTTSPATCKVPAVTPSVADCMMVFVANANDNTLFNALSGTNPVPEQVWGEVTALGLDAGMTLWDGLKSDAATSGARTATTVGNLGEATIGFTVALTPQPEIPILVMAPPRAG